ncbi:MAG TPA: hypothetical protein VN943_08170 [Candidatus Acidoferrum sp.]|nr:hypothetical protein [Candidatus Acidoferrum sp.]
MNTNFIWWSGIALEAVILLRGKNTGLLKKYPLFYFYIGCVLATEIIGVLIYQFAYDLYEPLYWSTELATIVASYAVIIEIFRCSTRHKPGLRRLAQNLFLIVFGLTVAYAASDFVQGGFGSLSAAILELGRDLRYVEGGVLLVMLWLFVRYRIPLGRNLVGLIIGYSFWVGFNVVNLAFWFLPGNEFSILLRGLLPATYVVTLIIWCVTLWSAHPEPVQPSETKIERDYELLASKTQAILARASSRVARIMKP